MAVSCECLDSVKVLLEARADPNAAGRSGCIPMNTAMQHSKGMIRVDIIKALLSARGDPNRRDGQGNTPLFFASDREVMDLLLNAGANPMVTNHTGLAALHSIISNENVMCEEDVV